MNVHMDALLLLDAQTIFNDARSDLFLLVFGRLKRKSCEKRLSLMFFSLSLLLLLRRRRRRSVFIDNPFSHTHTPITVRGIYYRL